MSLHPFRTRPPSPADLDASALAKRLGPAAQDGRVAASTCDNMCLTAGEHLSHAVPGLSDLGEQFALFAATMDSAEMTGATAALGEVAGDIVAIGTGLTSERMALDALIRRNDLMSRRIGDVTEKVRFLPAMVSTVKIELASIDYDGERFAGFAQNLEQLATAAQAALRTFENKHQTLLDQLRRTASAQSLFESAHHVKLSAAAQEIETSLALVSDRRKAFSDGATAIGAATRQISDMIGQSVAALQVGDSTRQRIEHVQSALELAVAIATNEEAASAHAIPAGAEAVVVGDICGLQTEQLRAAQNEFNADVATITGLLAHIIHDIRGLNTRSEALFASKNSEARSFLSDLEQKLEFAKSLIRTCGESRSQVDKTAETVIATCLDLDRMAKDVVTMATAMTIIGTNAIVTSYRLGSEGAGLSVVAQHLRSHALHVAEGVKMLVPVLGDVIESAHAFMAARQGQDAESMRHLVLRMTEALELFQSGDRRVLALRKQLEREVSNVSKTLQTATSSMAARSDIDTSLTQIAITLSEVAQAGRSNAGVPGLVNGPLADILRKHYTMAQERRIHDAFLDRIEAGETDRPLFPRAVA